ncbi:hypothetical protein [Novosphingobium sp.]|uniref:hypothetical protein n=1 Tax=Novosphingobium sp. TaxID=1874826 RepID=UPI0038BC1D47
MDDHPTSSHWRQMFERGKQDRQSGGGAAQRPGSPSPMPAFGYDDGHDPARQNATPLSPQQITDEAALALADDIQEYRPWILQRGTRPLIMLHLRRFDAKAGHWIGWQVSYPHLVAVEYVGDRMLSLDFGTRHFVIEGSGLGELARHLQTASVQTVLEFAPDVWTAARADLLIRSIRCLNVRGVQAG